MTTLSQTDSLSSGQRWLRALTEKLSGQNLAETFRQLLLPAIGIALFLGFWHLAAPQVQTSLGAFPGPADVSTATSGTGRRSLSPCRRIATNAS